MTRTYKRKTETNSSTCSRNDDPLGLQARLFHLQCSSSVSHRTGHVGLGRRRRLLFFHLLLSLSLLIRLPWSLHALLLPVLLLVMFAMFVFVAVFLVAVLVVLVVLLLLIMMVVVVVVVGVLVLVIVAVAAAVAADILSTILLLDRFKTFQHGPCRSPALLCVWERGLEAAN